MDEYLLTSYRNKFVSYDIVEGILKIQIFLEVSALSTGKGFVSFGGLKYLHFLGLFAQNFLCPVTEDGCVRLVRNVGKYLPDDTEDLIHYQHR